MRISGDAKTKAESKELSKAPLSSLKYLLHYLSPYRWMVAFALLALIVTSTSVLGMGYALRYLVDEGIAQGDSALLNRSYVMLICVIMLLALMTFLRFFFVSWVGERVVADIRNDIYAHLIGLDVTFYETQRSGELLSRMTTDTTLIQTVVGSSVSIALRNILLLIGGIAMLCITNLELTLYVLLIVPLVVVPIIMLGRKVRKLSRETQEKIADVNAHTEETVYAIQTIQALTLEQRKRAEFSNLIDASLTIAKQRITTRSCLTAIVITLVLGAVATVLWFGGQKVIAGTISAGELSSFVFYAMLVAGSTGAISEVIGDLQRAAGAVERLTELKQETSSLSTSTTTHAAAKGYISFDNVSFCYPSRPDIAALKQANFTVEKGETIAIVGPSGGGKTTIFRLLLRYYDPQQGCISIDNTPINVMDLQDIRHRIGIVPQDPAIFSASAYENIVIGNHDASKEDVMNAAKQAEIYDFLTSLPQGMDSFLGEKGIRLSGGQKQRIAIARALIRSPDILLLDEATSALDSDNERKVQAALEHVMRDRTTLVIAHRLSTIQGADKILLVNDGNIEASGTHQSLLKSNALYKKLAQQQFSNA